MTDLSPQKMQPNDYIADVNAAATYMLKLGGSFFLRDHLAFVDRYIDECARAGIDRNTLPRSVRYWLSFLLPATLKGVTTSVGKSAYKMMTHNIHSIPPLITSLVVVFVTSDAWKILGNGFTVRLVALWAIFMAASLWFLGNWNYWKDIEDSGDAEADLSEAVRACPAVIMFEEWGAEPAIFRPLSRGGKIYVLINYWLLSLLSLLGVAFIVSFTMIVIGAILITKAETATLAGSSFTYIPLPGNGAITRQLVSLSLVLGSFAAFFLVAGQRPDDRKEFMTTVIRPIRLTLLVYSAYEYARAHAKEWTKIDCPSAE